MFLKSRSNSVLTQRTQFALKSVNRLAIFDDSSCFKESDALHWEIRCCNDLASGTTF